jgi:hypothetical protein
VKSQATIIVSDRIKFTPRFIAFVLLAALLLLGLVRGSAQTADKPIAHPAGAYTLVSVDGKNVPCVLNHDGTTMSIESGTFTISTNGPITSVMTVSVGERKNVRIERHATYTMKKSELTMKWQNAGTTKGHLAGQTFTMTNEGKAYVYQK